HNGEVDLDDPILRKAATGKLAHALALARALRSDMDAWWATGPVSLIQELRSDGRTIDLVMLTSPVPPVDDWYNRAGDMLQNFRNALNRLTNSIGYTFTKPAKPSDGNFPIHNAEVGWQNWLKKHPEFPVDVADRFRAFEPFVSGRPFLLALRDSNNLEKHDIGFTVSVTLTELRMGGTFQAEGLWEDDHLGDQLKLIAGESFDIISERQVIGTIEIPTRVIEIGPDTDSKFFFTPMIRFDGNVIPFLTAIDSIGREVTWAIAYITGLVDNAIKPPPRIDL
ncbi:MAG TPA: hypothetical protein VF174_14905, partial [Micromonosporaceae bacterium]